MINAPRVIQKSVSKNPILNIYNRHFSAFKKSFGKQLMGTLKTGFLDKKGLTELHTNTCVCECMCERWREI